MSTNSPTIEYVPLGDTIADVAMQKQVSVGLTTSSSILLAMLVIISFVCNLVLVTTVLSSYKLRNSLLYLMFCSMGAWNLVDVLLIMFISLLYLSNGEWYFGEGLCRLNTWTQQFIFLKTITNLTLMAMERALGLKGNHLVTPKHFWVLTAVFIVVPICFATPIFFPNFPVDVYPNRYLCAIGRCSKFSEAPVGYTLVQLLVYGGCLFVLLLCFGSLLRHKSHDRSLPKKPQDYGAFIMESRALQDHLALGRVVLYMTVTFLLVEGPYICLNFFVQIRNSAELIVQYGEVTIPQDVDIVATWLKFFFPLLVPLVIFVSCNDIWVKCNNLLLCRRNTSYFIWNPITGITGITGNALLGPSNVLTLVATNEGLQLRVPTNVNYGGNPVVVAQQQTEIRPPPAISLIPSPRVYPANRRENPHAFMGNNSSQLTPVETPSHVGSGDHQRTNPGNVGSGSHQRTNLGDAAANGSHQTTTQVNSGSNRRHLRTNRGNAGGYEYRAPKPKRKHTTKPPRRNYNR